MKNSYSIMKVQLLNKKANIIPMNVYYFSINKKIIYDTAFFYSREFLVVF